LLKRLVLAALVLAGLAFGAVFALSARILSTDHGVAGHALAMEIPPPEDTLALAEGGRLALLYGCRDCHGEDLSGQIFIDEPGFLVLGAPNLTTGRVGSPSIYDPAAFERAVRHGVGPDGRNLVIMPSYEYNGMSDEELSLILAYARNVEPKANAPRGLQLGVGGRMPLIMAKEFLPVRMIDHEASHVELKEEGVSLEWGTRFARGCTGCHGSNLAGGSDGPGMPDGVPIPQNITPGNEAMADWDVDRFAAAVRAGVGSDDQQLDTFMPWQHLANLTDDEVESLWLYLSGLEALPDNLQ